MYQAVSIMCGNFKIYFLLFVISYSLLVVTPSVRAQTMSNNDYIIKTQGLNTVSGATATAEKDDNLGPTVNNLNPNVSEGVNFKVKSGFENLTSTLPFSISLSSNLIDLGILSPTNPIIRTVDLNINSKSASGYSVLVFENEPLTTILGSNKVIIPDTTCDNGQCGIQNAFGWTNALTYGFGYRCDNLTGVDCNNSFTSPNFYKHFPDLASNDDPQSIMAGIGANNQTTRISYKVNISGTQAQGTYNNIITYIAVPNF